MNKVNFDFDYIDFHRFVSSHFRSTCTVSIINRLQNKIPRVGSEITIYSSIQWVVGFCWLTEIATIYVTTPSCLFVGFSFFPAILSFHLSQSWIYLKKQCKMGNTIIVFYVCRIPDRLLLYRVMWALEQKVF